MKQIKCLETAANSVLVRVAFCIFKICVLFLVSLNASSEKNNTELYAEIMFKRQFDTAISILEKQNISDQRSIKYIKYGVDIAINCELEIFNRHPSYIVDAFTFAMIDKQVASKIKHGYSKRFFALMGKELIRLQNKGLDLRKVKQDAKSLFMDREEKLASCRRRKLESSEIRVGGPNTVYKLADT